MNQISICTKIGGKVIQNLECKDVEAPQRLVQLVHTGSLDTMRQEWKNPMIVQSYMQLQ